MARIRTVKPDLFKHEELYDLEVETKLPIRLAFIGLWCVCDREGRFKWRPNQLKIEVLPYDKCDFSRVLDALATRGFIEEYATETGEKYGYVPTFLAHQVINNRETKSLLPCPFDASSTRDPRALSTHKGKGKEGKGKGREEEGKGTTVTLAETTDGFEEFYSVYDKKVERPDAEKAWRKIAPNEQLFERIIKATKAYVRSTPDKKYRKNPATWLNGNCWNDEVIDSRQKSFQERRDEEAQRNIDEFVYGSAGRVIDVN